MRVVSVGKANEDRFLSFLDKDRALHIFTIYDLKHLRSKTKICVALKNAEIHGYLFEFDKRIVHTHGDAESVAKLLDCIDLDEPVFVIEPHHLQVIEESFKPVEPVDATSKGKITTFFVMRATRNTFKLLIKHRVKKLGTEDLEEVSKHLGEDYRKRVEEALRNGMAFGAYENESLASLATAPEIIEDLAIIRGVYTVPSFRGRGLATSASSALVEELIKLGKEVVLWVAKDNVAARTAYETIGFQKTGHVLLGFKAKKTVNSAL